MEGAGLFNPDPLFFPHLSRASLGLCDWRHLWTLLLRHVQEGRQESLAIFPHACPVDMFGSSLMYLLINWGS